MEEFLTLIKSKNIRALLIEPSKNLFVQLFRYLFVGGISFLVDSGVMYVLVLAGINPYLAVAIGFVFGLTVNYFLSKAFVFKQEKTSVRPAAEFAVYGIIGVIGLLLTEVIVYLFFELIGIHVLVSKIIAAAIVLIWNFAARKIILYRRKDS